MSRIRERIIKNKRHKAEVERLHAEREALRNDGRTMTVVIQYWDEREAGWGIRPDGFSLHLNKAHMEAYNKQYWDAEKRRNPSGVVPGEYSSPGGHDIIDVPYIVYVDLFKSQNGSLRFWGNAQFEREYGVKL